MPQTNTLKAGSFDNTLGIARRLFEQVEKDARSQGHAEITLDTWVFNTEAHDFFKAQGFQPSRYILRKTLSEHE